MTVFTAIVGTNSRITTPLDPEFSVSCEEVNYFSVDYFGAELFWAFCGLVLSELIWFSTSSWIIFGELIELKQPFWNSKFEIKNLKFENSETLIRDLPDGGTLAADGQKSVLFDPGELRCADKRFLHFPFSWRNFIRWAASPFRILAFRKRLDL